MSHQQSVSKRIFTKLLLIAAILLLVHLVLNYVSIVIYNHENGFMFELSNRFDVNDENSVPQWFSQIIFTSIAVTSFVAAYMHTAPSTKRLWTTIGAVGLILSIDDAATLHEFILQSLHNAFHMTEVATFFNSAWWLLFPFIATIGLSLIWWAWKILPRRTVILLALGGVVYIVGKLVTDSAANDVTNLFLYEGVMQGLEKLFQYSGSATILYGILDYLETNYAARFKKAVSALRR